MLSRRELLLLRAMYQQGTVTAAAHSIHMTQPAASALLKDMETRLGFALFSREHRRLHLTSQGRALIPEVLNALSGMESVDRLASDIRRGASDRLSVGAVAVAASMLLPQALLGVRRAYPHVTFTVRAGSGLEIIEMAVDHRIDLGIVIGASAPNERVHKEALAAVSLFAIFHPDHPLAEARSVTLAQVAALGLIALSPALPAGLATQRAFEGQGLDYRPLLEVAQSFTACELAGQQLGVAVVESLGARYAQRMGLVARHLLTMHDAALSLVSPRDRPLEGPSLCLRDALREAVRGLGVVAGA
ncbi:LysR family transcriptional regulator [Comamonas endophytica]|uniref:LysR family transcriptional regulator n=1 Tax=Comamonas endophytica TaxID=2949090 RepID=A0ABY6GAC2_9BURK|nr:MULTISPECIES: LysR family transcriptional regulator [unclassified Acidovorax]MCD2512212.1 LysR family transcriptional regulator [Acidovorax sp. D4N7]UYG51980.1 LysR family transcriptional regulator [Acidovorax sp. 5MLIR]